MCPTQAKGPGGPIMASGIDGMVLSPEIKRLAKEARDKGIEERLKEGTGPGEAESDEIDLAFLPDEFEYEIGDRVYVLRDLKIIQIRQLLRLVAKSDIRLRLNLDFTDPDALGQLKIEDIIADLIGQNIANVLRGLGDGLSEFFAIILNLEGEPLKQKNILKHADFFDTELDPAQATEVLSDFFAIGKRMQARASERAEARRAKLRARADEMKKAQAESETR